MSAEALEYVIWSFEHGAYWRPAECGYTRALAEAGRYSQADAERIIASANIASLNEIAILASAAEAADGARKRPAYVYTSRPAARSCPACARVLDAATGVSLDPADRAPAPSPGDVTCCAYCGTILVYAAEGFRLATSADLDGLELELRRLMLEYSASRTRPQPH